MKTIHINKKAIVPLLVSTIALSGCDPRHWPTDVSAECDVDEQVVNSLHAVSSQTEVTYLHDCAGPLYEENKRAAGIMNALIAGLILAALASNSDSTTTSGGGGGYTPPS